MTTKQYLLATLAALLATPSFCETVEITCADADSTGLMSAYTSHVFSVNPTVTDWHWEARAMLEGGTEKILATGTTSTFTLPAVTNEQQYERTADGCIRCRIVFSGYMAGIAMEAEYLANLDLKPAILNTSILSATDGTKGFPYKDLTVGISYAGSHYCYISLEEEANSDLRWYYSDEPDYTTYTFSNVYSLDPAWLSVTVRNAYGSASSTITLFDDESTSISGPTGNDSESVNGYDVFTIDGKLLAHIKHLEDVKSYPSGIYLLKTYMNGKWVTKKMRK